MPASWSDGSSNVTLGASLSAAITLLGAESKPITSMPETAVSEPAESNPPEPGTTAASTASDLTRSSASATVAASTTSKAPVSVTTAIALPTGPITADTTYAIAAARIDQPQITAVLATLVTVTVTPP